MFMRYISHEMRTPLNVACLGMKILRDELERLGLLSLLEVAVDTEKSCRTTVAILNDMLLFDKIVSGLLILEKRLIDPFDFISKVLSPFRLQVELPQQPFSLTSCNLRISSVRLGRRESTSRWSPVSPLFDYMSIHTRSRK